MSNQEVLLEGSPICDGIAIGRPFFFNIIEEIVPEFSVSPDELEGEVKRYRSAIKRSSHDVLRLKKQLESEMALEGAAILETHQQILQDPLITSCVEERIRKTHKNSEIVFQAVIEEYQKKFNQIGDKFFRERFRDILDVSRRIMGHLRKSVRMSLADIPDNSIVFARELTPSDTAEAKKNCVSAFVTEMGGETSHTAIMAKAKGIPYVSSIDFEWVESFKGNSVIVDGHTGKVILQPTAATLKAYQKVQKRLDSYYKSVEKVAPLATETIDGYQIRLSANIELLQEIDVLHQYQGCGVGLFRSEYMFLAHSEFPSEKEQFEVYRDILERMQGLPSVIRTFDIGGDKFGDFTEAHHEGNPFLGCRAIRFMLKERELFKAQIRALLRASIYGSLKIMFPMISGLGELTQAKRLVSEVKEELNKSGIPFDDSVQVGCMIEVPSAALTCDAIAPECDFLAIGTNDLVQYSLAVDRGNQSMSYLYAPTHPSVVRLMKMVVNEASRNQIPVSICGEIAADPRFTPLLLGLGVHELSVSSRYIPIIRKAIRSTSIVEAVKLAERILTLTTPQDILGLLIENYRETSPMAYHE